MKNFIKKSITTIVIIAMTLTLAMPVTAEAAAKVKLNKSKVTLTITKKKTKPSVQLKVKGTKKKAKWKTSNKKVATVSTKGKVTARKKGTAVITVKVSNRTLRCKVTVKDTRKKNTSGNNASKSGECRHNWVTKTEYVSIEGVTCACGQIFRTVEEYDEHYWSFVLKCFDENGNFHREKWTYGHASFSDGAMEIVSYKECTKCGFILE